MIDHLADTFVGQAGIEEISVSGENIYFLVDDGGNQELRSLVDTARQMTGRDVTVQEL